MKPATKQNIRSLTDGILKAATVSALVVIASELTSISAKLQPQYEILSSLSKFLGDKSVGQIKQELPNLNELSK